MFGRATITLGTGPHSIFILIHTDKVTTTSTNVCETAAE